MESPWFLDTPHNFLKLLDFWNTWFLKTSSFLKTPWFMETPHDFLNLLDKSPWFMETLHDFLKLLDFWKLSVFSVNLPWFLETPLDFLKLPLISWNSPWFKKNSPLFLETPLDFLMLPYSTQELQSYVLCHISFRYSWVYLNNLYLFVCIFNKRMEPLDYMSLITNNRKSVPKINQFKPREQKTTILIDKSINQNLNEIFCPVIKRWLT